MVFQAVLKLREQKVVTEKQDLAADTEVGDCLV